MTRYTAVLFAVAAYGQSPLVRDARTWTEKRRPELIRQFETSVYGRAPVGRPKEMTWEVVAEDRHGFGGKAITKTVKLYFAGKKDGPSMELSLILPNTGKPAPVFAIAGNARSNQVALDSGYGLVSCRVDQIQIDGPNGYATSIRGYFARKGQTEPADDEWGAIAAWAWGLSRAMDYLETDPDVDARRVCLEGLSRLGKVVLWAGALDPRFAITFSTDAGCGEDNREPAAGRFAYWFDRNFTSRARPPLGCSELVALFAPRPVYIATAEEDESRDPRGSFLAAQGADPVYKLFGETGVGVDRMPLLDMPVGDFVGFHARKGEHGLTKYDWEQYLKFADRHFGIARK
ncbi:MAG: acetylxylan esterase [Bryobacteraceae bacterium]